MKLALVGDIHYGIRSSSPFFLEYQLSYFTEEVIPRLKKEGVDTILTTGDFFHSRKTLDFFVYHHVKQRFLDVLKRDGFKLITIPGNHDMYYVGASDITGLSILSEYDCVEVIRTPTVKDFDGTKIGFIPWISNEQEKAEFLKFTQTCNCSILFGHFEFNSYYVMPGIQHQGGLKEDDFRGFDTIFSGHLHLKQRRPESNVFYLGSPTEFDWGDHGQEKGFYIFDTKTQQVEFVKNRRYIHYKVIYDEDKLKELNQDLPKLKGKIVRLIVANKRNEKLFTSFVYNLEQVGPIMYNIIDTPDNQVGAYEEHYQEQNLFDVIEAYVKEKYDKPERITLMLKKLYQDVTPQTSTVQDV